MRPLVRRLGYAILDRTTRSWGAFWGTILVCLLYAIWNSIAGARFDPYPFIFLTLLLTFFSYLQNIVIMTVQRSADMAQARQEEADARQERYMLHIMEALYVHLVGEPPPADDGLSGAGLDGDRPGESA